MQPGQAVRKAVSGAKDKAQNTMDKLAAADREQWKVWLKRIGAVLILFCLLYYPVGMAWVHQVNDDISGTPGDGPLEPGQSRTVSVISALVDREVNDTHWVANDPFIYPGVLLDNMPNFQMGLIGACARFSFELADQLGRTRGSSQIDTDLQDASGLLQYSGTRWVWDLSVSVLPTATSEQQYNRALKALRSYNDRLAKQDAVFERRADNLLATLDRIALDIGSSSAVLDKGVSESGWLLDFNADDIFYGVKGQMYGYLMILRGLREDFASVIREKELENSYAQMLESIEHAVGLDPWVVVNGAPDSQVLPSHLTSLGFYLLRARTQLREITNILLK